MLNKAGVPQSKQWIKVTQKRQHINQQTCAQREQRLVRSAGDECCCAAADVAVVLQRAVLLGRPQAVMKHE